MHISRSTKENRLFLRRIFSAELRINLDEGGHKEGDGAERHDDDEERTIAHCILQEATEHAGYL